MAGKDEGAGLEIAVIGMAGRFPGASSIAEFWEVIRAGREVISHFTDAEAAAAGVPPEQLERPDYVKAGGLLDDAECFDATLFGYTPRDAALLDPQQRIFLECAWAALEDAGYNSERDRGLVGVYASISRGTYFDQQLGSNRATSAGLTGYEVNLANDKDTLATRAAYHLDLQGPALSVQCGCSSSLVGIHLACQALLSGECDLALAGGVSVFFPQRAGYSAREGGVMSADGHVYAFDSRANGTVDGDGVGVVVLKPLADALHDRDAIRALVKGTAVNNDGGRRVGFTAPRAAGQSAVIRMAHQAAGVPAETISYVETHGTGTALGDPIEFTALADAFAGVQRGSCALGAVKAQIGHLDAAAGVTGFIKTVLALEHRCIPPSPYFRQANPEIDLAESPFRIPVEPETWVGGAHPRRAAASSFGMGGTNAHVVLEEAPAARPRRPPARPAQLLVLSAATRRALRDSATRLRDHLAADSGDDAAALADAAFTTQVGRRALRHRLAVVCGDRREAVERLGGRIDGAPGVAIGAPAAGDRPVAYLFPGQGAQHPGMAQGLYEVEPTFRRWFDTCADLLAGELAVDLRAVVSASPDGAGTRELLDRTEYTQPALFATEYSLAQLWLEWGVRPWAMLGHSVGEYTAACLAGTFELPDALRLVAARGRLMQSRPAGVMAAVHLAGSALERQLPPGVCLAAVNSGELSVVSGPAEPVAMLLAELKRRSVRHSVLRTSHAFHSSMMDPIVGEFRESVRAVRARPPRVPFVSNVTGRWITDEDAVSPDYWARHLREPVRFHDGVRRLLDGAQERILLEVGPGTTLTALVSRPDFAAGGHRAVASLSHPGRPEHDTWAVLGALGALYASGAALDWSGFWARDQPGRAPLPTYPFERRSHWLGSPQLADGGAAPAPAPVPADDPVLTVAEQVLEIWRELLGIHEISPDDDFFALGGHSLLATRIVALIRDTIAVELPAAALFDAPTLAALTELVERSAQEAQEQTDQLLALLSEQSAPELRSLLAKDIDG